MNFAISFRCFALDTNYQVCKYCKTLAATCKYFQPGGSKINIYRMSKQETINSSQTKEEWIKINFYINNFFNKFTKSSKRKFYILVTKLHVALYRSTLTTFIAVIGFCQ